jgi:chemotaxis protein histidine kinase CheA
MNPSFQERFEALCRDWRRQLPQRLQEIQARLAACRAAPDDADGLRELHRLLHTLAGSAGTFGLDALGEQARAIEHAVDALLARPARTAADLAPVDTALAALVDAAPQSE